MLRSFLTLIALQLLNCRPGNSQARPSEAVQLRLANGQSRCAGRVEIYYRGQWGTVLSFGWKLHDADVVCGELGCGPAVSAPGGAHFGEGSGPVVTSEVQCEGTETALRECRSAPWGDYSHYGAAHSYDAGVICSGAELSPTVPPTPSAPALTDSDDAESETTDSDGALAAEPGP